MLVTDSWNLYWLKDNVAYGDGSSISRFCEINFILVFPNASILPLFGKVSAKRVQPTVMDIQKSPGGALRGVDEQSTAPSMVISNPTKTSSNLKKKRIWRNYICNSEQAATKIVWYVKCQTAGGSKQ